MNPLAWLRTSRNGDRRPAGHMTWAHTSVGRSITRTGVFLKRQIWIWPILAVVLLSILGFFVRRAIENTMRDNLVSQLQTLVDLETAMLENWSHVQESNAESLANNVDIRQTIYPLLEAPAGTPRTNQQRPPRRSAPNSRNRSARRSRPIGTLATW